MENDKALSVLSANLATQSTLSVEYTVYKYQREKKLLMIEGYTLNGSNLYLYRSHLFLIA